MEITVEKLKELGFEEKNPNPVFSRLRKLGKDPETYIGVSKEYQGKEREVVWEVNCWRADETGAIIRRSSVSGIRTFEDLKACTDLCGVIF
jgi:hypothetical protein